jgi:hypothetical protein
MSIPNDLPDPDIILKIEEANKWKNDRLNTYEVWGNQLDKLWHDIDNGTLDKNGEWYKAIKQIKEDNPKPTNLEHLEQEIEDMITAERDAKTSRDWNL